MSTSREPIETRAREIAESTIVVHLAEAVAIRDPLDLNSAHIEQWRESHFNVLGCVTFTNNRDKHSGALEQLARWNSAIAEHGDELLRIDNGHDLKLVESSDRIGILLSLHFGEHIQELTDVDTFHRLGQRNCVITNDRQNLIGAAAQERDNRGLSDFGQAVVERMVSVGMAVDLSHASEQTALDAIGAASGPVILSHTNAHALCPNIKNKSDEVFKKVAAAGGLVGIGAVRCVVSTKQSVTAEDLLDHFEYISRLVGPEFVALGFESPIRGYDRLPGKPVWPSWVPPGSLLDIDGFVDVDRVTLVTAGLLRRGFTEDDIRAILGGNALRVLAQIMAGRRSTAAAEEASASRSAAV
jgi:membrane dipeptidase